jgi:hypothetical protein
MSGGGGDPDVAVEGSTSEMFALMLHDRIVDLERQFASMCSPPLDARIELADQADSRDVFVRLRCCREIDGDEWAAAVCTRLGQRWSCEMDVAVCQHFDIDNTFVLEAVLCFDAHRPVAQVAHAALDAAGDALAPSVRQPVLASAVHSREWFVESVRAAAGDYATVWSWEPVEQKAVKEPLDIWIEDDGWCMLQGWLAHNRERVEVLHPRALHAQIQARRLWSFVARLS